MTRNKIFRWNLYREERQKRKRNEHGKKVKK